MRECARDEGLMKDACREGIRYRVASVYRSRESIETFEDEDTESSESFNIFCRRLYWDFLLLTPWLLWAPIGA